MPRAWRGYDGDLFSPRPLRQATERLSHAHIKQFGSDEQMFGAEQQAQDEEQSD
jgi:hypothetical protein